MPEHGWTPVIRLALEGPGAATAATATTSRSSQKCYKTFCKILTNYFSKEGSRGGGGGGGGGGFGLINKLNLQILYNLTLCKFYFFLNLDGLFLRIGFIKVPPKNLISSSHKSN